MFAPYKVHLEDGRDIFAPQDIEQVIRVNPGDETDVGEDIDHSPD
jgi:hypothetical protein